MHIATIADIRQLEQQPYNQLVPRHSIHDIFRQAVDKQGKHPALSYSESGDPDQPLLTTSYSELLGRITQAANLFHHHGIGREQSVGVLLPNIPEAHFAIWGAETVARACPINFLLRTEYIIDLLRAADARVLVALGPDPELGIWPMVEHIVAALPQLKLVCQVPGGNAPTPGAPLFLECLDEHNHIDLDFTHRANRQDVAAVYHTGGTTGAPKLVQHTHGNHIHLSWSMQQLGDIRPDDLLINGTPVFHVAGALAFGLAAFVGGAGLLLPTRTGLRNKEFVNNYWHFVDKYKITMLGCVPTVISALMNVPVDDADISSVRVAWTGGSHLPNELAAAFEQQTGIPVRNILGMTECSGPVSIAPIHGKRVPDSTGLRLPFSEVRAFRTGPEGPDMSQPCELNETGVVAIRGPHVSPGYTDPSRNKGVFTDDGWLISGDLGWVDENGQLFIKGRVKDVIIRSAHTIDPEMIEEIAYQHPAVHLCAAIGQPDAYAGELPIIYISVKPGMTLQEDEILAFIEQRIPERPAMPKRAVIIDTMPLTAVGKIYKPALRAMAMEHVVHQTLAPTVGEIKVTIIEENGRQIASISLPESGHHQARELLRDFTFDYRLLKPD